MTRVIPCLLLQDAGFYKTVAFEQPVYLGDPVNVLRIFNEKEVDEIVIFDITAARTRRAPNFELLAELAGECFMPLAYGGGVSSVTHAKRLLSIGFEKVSINTAALDHPELITELSELIGSQSVVVCIDAKRTFLGGWNVYADGGQRRLKLTPAEWAQRVEQLGAGEIVIQSIERDGTMRGYDVGLINDVSSVVSIPVVAVGGAATVSDFAKAVNVGGASACAAGAMFVFQGRHRAVLINVPTRQEIDSVLSRPGTNA
jgi:imidazole glycerol-phosphate synthase subunit HisF